MDQTQRKPVFFIVSSKLIFVVFCFMGLMYILIHEIITVIIERQVFNGIRSVLLCLRLYAAQRQYLKQIIICLFIRQSNNKTGNYLWRNRCPGNIAPGNRNEAGTGNRKMAENYI
jgi:hypothetical protein